MLAKAFSKGIGTNRKTLAVNVVLFVSAFIWYFYAFDYLRRMADFNNLASWGTTFLGISSAALVGTLFIEKFKRRFFFLRIWILAGIPLSVSPIVANATTTVGILAISAVIGAYFGFGIPICMGYFAASAGTEKRARLGGVTVLFMGVGLFFFGNLVIEDAVLTSLVLASLQIGALAFLVLLKPEERPALKENRVSYRFVISYKPFLLYFVPWIMFCLVNNLTSGVKSSLFPNDAQFVYNSEIAANLLAGIFAVLGGFFADAIGRKRLAVVGFASLGMAYAFLGFSSAGNLFAWYFYTAVDGIAWGAFYTIFLITLWGDLAQHRNAEKFYAIGSLPYIFSNFARLSIGSFITSSITETYQIFSFASLFIFAAVLPLIFAPETLPEKVIKERELEIYVKQAQEIAQKYY